MTTVSNANEGGVVLSNALAIDIACKGKLWSYLELQDRILLLVNIYDIERCNQYRNIFCHAKTDGSLLWQVQQPYDHRNGKPLEEVFKNIKLYIEQSDGKLKRYGDPKEYPWDNQVAGNAYDKPFRKGLDKIGTMTLGQFPNEYWIDYETGKLEWIAIHQKI